MPPPGTASTAQRITAHTAHTAVSWLPATSLKPDNRPWVGLHAVKDVAVISRAVCAHTTVIAVGPLAQAMCVRILGSPAHHTTVVLKPVMIHPSSSTPKALPCPLTASSLPASGVRLAATTRRTAPFSCSLAAR